MSRTRPRDRQEGTGDRGPGTREVGVHVLALVGLMLAPSGVWSQAPPQPAPEEVSPSSPSTPEVAPKDPWKAWALGRFDRALEGFLDRQIARPDDAAIHRNVAAARYRLGDFAGASQAYAEAVEKATDPAVKERALYDLGNAAYRQGQLEDAVKAYEAALEIDPEDEDARYNLELVREEIRRRLEEAAKREQEQQQEQQQEQDQEQEQEQQQDQQQEQPQEEGGEQPQQDEQGEPQPQPEPSEPEEGDEPSEAQPQPGEPTEPGELSPEEVEALLRSIEEGRPAETAPPRPARRTRPAKDW